MRSRTRATVGTASTRSRAGMVATATLVLLGLFVGGVGAAWLITGSGQGRALGGRAVALVLTAGEPTDALLPGGTASVVTTVTNGNRFPLVVTEFVQDGQIQSGAEGCTPENHGVSFATQTGEWNVPGDGQQTITLSAAVSMSLDSADACQGAMFTVPLRVAAKPGTSDNPTDPGGQGGTDGDTGGGGDTGGDTGTGQLGEASLTVDSFQAGIIIPTTISNAVDKPGCIQLNIGTPSTDGVRVFLQPEFENDPLLALETTRRTDRILDVRFPAGAAIGLYDLIVVELDGRWGSLPGALTISDADADQDGILDIEELGSSWNPENQTGARDTDTDGTPDYLDPDSDGDGFLDVDEYGDDCRGPVVSTDTGIPDYLNRNYPVVQN